MVNENLTFSGYPVTFEKKDGESYITCKGLTGIIKQVLLENGISTKRIK